MCYPKGSSVYVKGLGLDMIAGWVGHICLIELRLLPLLYIYAAKKMYAFNSITGNIALALSVYIVSARQLLKYLQVSVRVQPEENKGWYSRMSLLTWEVYHALLDPSRTWNLLLGATIYGR